MEKFILIANRINRVIDYKALKPTYIVSRHYEYILQAKLLKKKSEGSLYTEVMMMRYLFNFLENKKIDDLSLFTYSLVQELYSFLATAKSKIGKPLSKSSQRLVYTFFKSFSLWLSDYYPAEAPPINIFLKSKFKGSNDTVKTQIISDFVLEQVKKAIRNENDPYIKAYILVLLYYGLRSIDIVSLTKDCLLLSDKDGKYDLQYIDHKQNERIVIPAISSPVARALSTLVHHTHDLCVESGLKTIFIKKYKNNIVKPFLPYQNNLLDSFVKKHNIINENGSEAQIASHMFRRTLATNLQSSGASLETTQTVMNHKHKRTTMQYYIKTKDEDYIAQISDTLEHMQIISSTHDIAIVEPDFRFDNSFRLPDGYCVNTMMATDDDYICDTLQKRGNCYGCSKMITTPEFLPYFKTLYKEKEEEIESKSFYGSHVIQHIEFERDVIGLLIEKLETFGDTL